MSVIKLCSKCASAAKDAFNVRILSADGKMGKCGHCGRSGYLLEYEVKKR